MASCASRPLARKRWQTGTASVARELPRLRARHRLRLPGRSRPGPTPRLHCAGTAAAEPVGVVRRLADRRSSGQAHGIDVDEDGNGTADYQRMYQLMLSSRVAWASFAITGATAHDVGSESASRTSAVNVEWS